MFKSYLQMLFFLTASVIADDWYILAIIFSLQGASAISVIEVNQLPTEIDPSHAQPLQPGQCSASF